MFDEKFDDKATYTIYGGRRGLGRIAFMQHLLAKRTSQLMAAQAKIAELEKQLLKKEIHEAYGRKNGKNPYVTYIDQMKP